MVAPLHLAHVAVIVIHCTGSGIPRISSAPLGEDRNAAELRRPVTCLKQSQSSFLCEPQGPFVSLRRTWCVTRDSWVALLGSNSFREISAGMSDPDQEEMRRKRLARLSALGAEKKEQEVVGATSPTAASPTRPLASAPLTPVQKMEVDPAQSCGLKARASQVSLDFDSGIENMELEECR